MIGQTVLIIGKHAFDCRVDFVENPYQLRCEYAFPHEIEAKFIRWVRERKIRSNSDYTHVWMDGWQLSGSPLNHDDWWRMIMHEAEKGTRYERRFKAVDQQARR